MSSFEAERRRRSLGILISACIIGIISQSIDNSGAFYPSNKGNHRAALDIDNYTSKSIGFRQLVQLTQHLSQTLCLKHPPFV